MIEPEKKREAGISVGRESRLLAKHSVIYGIGTTLNKAAAFILLPVYTRFLTIHDFGVKELVALTAEIITTVLAASVASAFYRFYFEYEDPEDRDLVLSSSYLFMGVTGLFFVVLLSLASPLLSRRILDSDGLSILFLLAFGSMWFQMMNVIGLYYLRATMRSIQYNVISILRLCLAIGLNIYLIVYLNLGVLGIFVSTLVASMAAFLVLNVPQLLRTGLKFSPRIIRDMLSFGLPMVPSELCSIVARISDRFFIKSSCSIADAGLYALSFRFGLLPGILVSEPFNQVWQPRRIEVCRQPNSEEVFGRIFTYFLVLISWAALLTAVLTREVLMVMADRQFWSAYRIVPVIVLADVIFTLHYHFNMGIIIEKKTKYFAYINVSNGILHLLLNFLLIPVYGVWGAACATLASFTCLTTATYLVSRRFYRVHLEPARLAKIFIAAVVVYFAAQQVSVDDLLLSMLAKTAVVLSFPLLIHALGFFTEDEKARIRAFLRSHLKAGKAGNP